MHAHPLVQAYLTAMEARDLALAQSMLAPQGHLSGRRLVPAGSLVP